ncbi:glycoside hydrolase [Chitinophaga sp.]|uniref:glycoside hydrolase n=1 Tax=Chitinophaga sp. TaxID=1869181 RepID=UPI0031DC5F60
MNIATISLVALLACGKNSVPAKDPCLVNGTDTCAAKNTALTATINLAAEKQVMHSFGASDCWGIKFIGKNWPENKRNQIADLLFSKEMDAQGNPKGIGLSMWRINIGAGSFEQGEGSNISSPWRREESFQLPDGSYDWSKQAGNQWFARAAKARNVENFLLFSISAPVHMTKNGYAFAPGGADKGKLNLQPGKMDAFAGFLADVTKHYTDAGIPVGYISPLNEPQWDWMAGNNGKATQEGTPATNEEAFTLIKALDAQMAAKSLSAKIAFGEAGALNYIYGPVSTAPERSDVFNYFWNPSGKGYIGALRSVEPVMTSHSYFAQPDVPTLISHRQQLASRMSAINPQVHYWQTEYCVLGKEDGIKGGGRDLGMNTALYIARIIHTDIVIGNATSWQWWLAVSPSDYKDGLVYVSDVNGTMGELPATQQDGTVHSSKMLWALGNYSRFVRPGMVRVDAALQNNTAPETAAANLMVSAYKNPATKEVVTVLINMTNKDEEISLSGLQLASPEVAVYTTSEKDELRHTQGNAAKGIALGARSVVTVVGKYR